MILFRSILDTRTLQVPDIVVTTSHDLKRDFITPMYFGLIRCELVQRKIPFRLLVINSVEVRILSSMYICSQREGKFLSIDGKKVTQDTVKPF